jgi:ATP-dependent protease ClpP protease subunit
MRTALSTLLLAVLLAAPASALEMTERQVALKAELKMEEAHKAAQTLFKLDAMGNEPILLIISTRAGYVPAAMVVADAISAIKAPVYAVIASEAFGVGAVIAAFCDRRYAFPHAQVLFSKLEYDSKKAMKEEPPLPAEHAQTYINRVYASVAARLKMRASDFQSKAEAGWYMSAEEARKAGVVTKVVKSVSWIDLVVETVEIKRTATTKTKRPIASEKP